MTTPPAPAARRGRRHRAAAAATALAAGLALALTACTSPSDPAPTTDASAGACPTTPVKVVVSVDQWGDLVHQLGGACADVTTILAGSSVDPHDYEPTPADAVKFNGAQLVVLNGAHYDEWASKLAATAAGSAPVVDAGVVAGVADGANPHLWYSPDVVTQVVEQVTGALTQLAPAATDYFTAQRAAVVASLQPYEDLIATIKQGASGKTFGATEGVFDYMAQAVGLTDATPPGFARAAANESDPSPADLQAFISALGSGKVDVLIFNTQTEGSVPTQVRDAAQRADVPVVEVTETVAPGADSFQDWQMSQLTALAKALGVDA